MSSSRLIAVVIAVLAVLWIGSSILTDKQSDAESVAAAQEQTQTIPDVAVENSMASTFEDRVVITGRTEASRRVDLRAETNGTLAELVQVEGALVKAGDLLARLEMEDREARVKEARQKVSQRQIEYDAARKLEEKGFNSKVRKAQVLADLEQARAELKRAEIDRDHTRIKAPFDGLIQDHLVEEGDYVSIGSPLFRIVDLDPLEVTGYVSERHVEALKQGTKTVIETLGGQKFEGIVSYIAPAADENTKTFRIVVQIDNEALMLKSGLTAKITIPVRGIPAHKISPSVLTLNDEGRVGVKIVRENNNIVAFIPVQPLADTEDGMWVAGLPEAARIIITGQEFVQDGQKVKPVVQSVLPE